MDEQQKKIHDLETELMIRNKLEKEREESDKLYAIKLSEKAVFAIIGLMGLTVAGALIKVAISYINGILR